MSTVPTMYLLCGLPRSGKTTWAEKNREGKVLLSADTFRVIVHGKGFVKEDEFIVWALFDGTLDKILQTDRDVIIDNTNISKGQRERLLDKAKFKGYKTILVYFSTPTDVCKQRAKFMFANEYLQAYLDCIDSMSCTFQPPDISEGFSDLIEIEGE